MSRGHYFFACQFLEPLKFGWGVHQNGNFYREKSISRREKIPKISEKGKLA